MIGALASPYLQYYLFERQIIEGQGNRVPRGVAVALVNHRIRTAMLSGEANVYDKLLGARGGYALGGAVGRFLEAYFGASAPIVMNLCSSENRLSSALSEMLIAPEMPMRVAAGSIMSIAQESSAAADLLGLISPIAIAEENLVAAAISLDRVKLEKAMIVHPLVRQPNKISELTGYIESTWSSQT